MLITKLSQDVSDLVWNLGRQIILWLWLDEYSTLKRTTKVIYLQGQKQILHLPRREACPKLILKNQNLLFLLPVIKHKMAPEPFILLPSLNILFATSLFF